MATYLASDRVKCCGGGGGGGGGAGRLTSPAALLALARER